MNTLVRTILAVVVVAALVTGFVPGGDGRCACGHGSACADPVPVDATIAPASAATVAQAAASVAAAVVASPPASAPAATGPLPKLIDLGADKCVPCRKMAPILEEAKKLYAGLAEVEFIDVWKNRDAGSKYGIRTIPTQIFFDAAGNELFRHEGFFSMEDIQKQFASMGVALPKP